MALSNQGQARDWCLRSVLERKDDTSVVSARIVLRVSWRSFLANVSVVVLSVEIMSEQVVALEHFALEEREVEQALARVNVRAVDYADIYFESTIAESVSMEEGIVKRAVKSISQGAGVRATSGEKTGFAYSNELSKRDLEIAADTARYIADSPKGDVPVPVTHRPAGTHNLYPLEQPSYRRRHAGACGSAQPDRSGSAPL